MKDYTKLKDYRTLYKRHYEIDFNSSYQIHHLNCIHTDNRIENLLLLPTDLHQKYHFYKENAEISRDLINFNITSGLNNSNVYAIEQIQNFIKILEECSKWYDYKLYLDGILPNIHNIVLEV